MFRCRFRFHFGLVCWLMSGPLSAQLTDVTQTPNAANEGIAKSYELQVGVGQGTIFTPGSSRFLIARDPFRSIARGRQVFQRKFTMAQGFGPRTGDGTGNIEAETSLGAGLVDSCAGCHGRPRGAAGFGGTVFTRPDSRDAPHLFGLGLVEMLADEITSELRRLRDEALQRAQSSGAPVVQSLVAKGISYGSLTAHPNGSIDTGAVVGVDPDLRVKPFFAEGSVFSIREFAVGALDAEMGLEAVDPVLAAAAAGADVTTPAGMGLPGSVDPIQGPVASSATADPDGDGVSNEVPASIVDHLEFYLLNYFAPATGQQRAEIELVGSSLMDTIGCTECHVRDLVVESDRRVADVQTVFDPVNGAFNQLFATAATRFVTVVDSPDLPAQKQPAGGAFVVRNIFADFRRHDLGPAFHERNFDGTMQTHFVTEPLWGVGSTPPYGHDGRSSTLRDVILRHGGEALASRQAFEALDPFRQEQVLAFLRSMVLFGPPDTASNLEPAQPGMPGYPQFGHGSIALAPLFNDPSDPE